MLKYANMGRIDQTVYESVKGRTVFYSNLWGLKTALSAGIIALDMLTPQQREIAVGMAKNQIPYHTKYALLTPDESELLKEFKKKTPHLSDDINADSKRIVDTVADESAGGGKKKKKDGSIPA